MTICIAAIAKHHDKECIVFATDHMVTCSAGQFEHSIVKYRKINPSNVAMLAGHALLFDSLIELNEPEKLNYLQIKENICNNFQKKRNEIIENEIFKPIGINHKFFIESLKKEIPNPFVRTILDQVHNFKMNTSILLTGFYKGTAMISEISETGANEFRSMNFHTIGSGAIQAMNTLLFQKHSKMASLKEALYNVYKAKRNAEAMEGVGKETELLILFEDSLLSLNNDEINLLDEIYIKELDWGKNSTKIDDIMKKRGL